MVLRRLMGSFGTGPKSPRNLSREEASQAFTAILNGSESDALVASFLVTLRWKGVTTEELMGMAMSARAQSRIPCMGMSGLVTVAPPQDGHDTIPPLEVGAGIVAAAAGARVLIVSDRCVPPRRGLTAANVLEGLGLSMTWDSTEAEDWITKAGFATVSVAGLCPPLLSLRKVRGDMIVRTPLSTLEKLIAPPGSAMLIGAQRGPVLGAAVEVLKGLGHRRGVALQGPEGSVVPFVTKRTRGIELDGDHLVSVTVEPADFGLDGSVEPELPLFGPAEDGQGSSDNPVLCQSASDTVQAVLAGEPGAARNATLLSAALMLKACGRCMTIAEGVDAATSALDSGAALERVARLRSLIA
ncbi:MAG: hypothetical protein ISQ11_09195 [Planctomycetes bacterium]|nr:hypothetical protein [Planctomycetota bacterium]